MILTLAFRPPYDWTQVLDFLATRAVPGVERVDARGYARTLAIAGGHAIVCVRAVEGENALELRVRGAAPAALFQIAAAARRVFDLAADPARIAVAFRRDALLAPLVKRRPGLRIPGMWDPFECAVRAVLGQQVSVAAGRTLAARLVARIGQPIAGGEDGLTHLFPSPAAMAVADLDGLGITGARVRALQALAEAVTRGASISERRRKRSPRPWWRCPGSVRGPRSTSRCARSASPTRFPSATWCCGGWRRRMVRC